MKKISTIAVAVAAAATLGLSFASRAQYAGGMGYGSGMMTPGTRPASPIARGTNYRYGMMAGDYCYGMMDPGTGYGYSMTGPWNGSGYADPDVAAQACLSSLHDQLGISVAQEAAWQAFAQAVTDQAQGMSMFRQQTLQAAATAPERVAQYAQFMLDRAQDAAAVSQAVSALYATLSPSQQAVFNQYFAWGM